jgi:hypothetical protein
MAPDSERFRRRGSSAIELYVRELVRSVGTPVRNPVEWPSASRSEAAGKSSESLTETQRASDRIGRRFTSRE